MEEGPMPSATAASPGNRITPPIAGARDISPVRALRLAGPLFAVLAIIYVAIGEHNRVSGAHGLGRLGSAIVATSVLFAAIAWTPLIYRSWRLCTITFCTVLIGLFVWASALTAAREASFLVIILCPLATALLLGWGPRWQAALSLVCLIGLAVAEFSVPLRNPDSLLRWLGLLAALVLAQFATASFEPREGERSPRLRQPAEVASKKENQLAVLAHDIRSPLAAVAGFANLIDEENIDPADREAAIGRMIAAARAIDLLVGNALDLNAIERGYLEPRRRSIDPNSIASEIARESAKKARSNGVELRTEFGPAPQVEFDPFHLERILKNLLAVAIERTTRGRVSVNSVALDGCVRIEVIDSGPTLDSAALAQLFEHPASLAGKTSPPNLCLFIARTLAEANGGRIEAASGNGQGLRVAIELPLASA